MKEKGGVQLLRTLLRLTANVSKLAESQLTLNNLLHFTFGQTQIH